MKTKKLVALLLAMLMVVSLFVGCNKPAADDSSNDVQNEVGANPADDAVVEDNAAEPVTLTVWNSSAGAVDAGYQAIIDAYCAEHENVKIEFSAYTDPEYTTKLQSALSAGTGPDLYFTTGWNNLQTYVDAGYAENLDGKLNIDAFSQDALDVETINGSLYGAPGVYAQYLSVYYNKDLFAQAGINSFPTTYDEFIAACDALKAAGITPIAMGGQEATPYMFAWLITTQAMSSEFFNDIRSGKANTLADARFESGMQMLLDWGEAGYYQDNYEGTDGAMQTVLFTTEQAAMIFTGSWSVADFRTQNAEMNIGSFAFPGTEATYGVRSVTSSLSLNSASANKDVAIDFLNFTLTPAAQQIMVDAVAGIPVTDEATINDALMQEVATAPDYAAFPNIAMNIAGANDSNPQNVFCDYILSVANGERTIHELAELMNEVWNAEAYAALFK